MSYNLTVIDETWGDHQPVGRKATVPTFADLKSLVSIVAEETVKEIIQYTDQWRISTIAEVPKARFVVLVEWCPDGRLWNGDDTLDTASDIGIQRSLVLSGLRNGL